MTLEYVLWKRLHRLVSTSITCVTVIFRGLGGHTLSGAVLEPTALQELFPDWKDRGVRVTRATLVLIQQ